MEGILTILVLGTESPGGDHHHAVSGNAPVRKLQKALANFIGQRCCFFYVKAQLCRGGSLVDMLPAGSGCPYELNLYFVLTDGDVGSDRDHACRLY